jgi:hypothetical protein
MKKPDSVRAISVSSGAALLAAAATAAVAAVWTRRRGGDGGGRPGESEAQPTFERDVLLKEFDVLRQEMLQQLNNSELNYSILVAISAAILGSQIIFDHISSLHTEISAHPIILLVAAFISLWFPASGITKLVNITVIAAYFNDVLIPKINFFAVLDTSESAVGQLISQPSGLAGFDAGRDPLMWEVYRAKALYPRRRRLILTPIGIMRSSILWTPSVLLIIFYAQQRTGSSKAGLTWYEVLLLVLYCVFVVCSIVAFFAHGSLTRVHQRHWR